MKSTNHVNIKFLGPFDTQHKYKITIRDSLPISNKNTDKYVVYSNYRLRLTEKILELTKCRVGGCTLKFLSELRYQSDGFIIYSVTGYETGVRSFPSSNIIKT